MARELKTGWVKIATSGFTSDGREIKKQWLTDMAEHYNPKVYSSRLWPDHLRFFGPQGKVLALKIEPAIEPELEGEIHLSAILAPSDELIYANKNGHYTHTSIEVFENFAGKGFTYLAGLGVTDIPASLGTDELKFSQQEPGTFTIPGNSFDLSTAVAQDKGVFARFFGGKDPSHQENDAMNNEQFAQLMTALQAQTAEFTSLKAAFTAQPAAQIEPASESEVETVTAEQFGELKAQFEQLSTQYSQLNDQLQQALNKPAAGTQADEVTGSATDEAL